MTRHVPIADPIGVLTSVTHAERFSRWTRASTVWLRVMPQACIMLALGTLLLPVALTHMPPLLDYPNHVVRLWLIAGGAALAPLSAMYSVDWSSATANIGTDLIAAALGQLVGVWTLAPILLGAAVLLPPLGAVLLNRAVFGGWHWWQAGFAVLAWNGTLMAGFLNFQIGLGLALLAAALDPSASRWAGPFRVVPVRMGLAAGLMVFHPFAAGFYGVLLSGLAFGAGHKVAAEATPLSRRLWRAASAAGLGVGIPIACFLLLSPTPPGKYAPAGTFDPWIGYTIVSKIVTLLTAVATYNLALDLIFVLTLWTAAIFIASRCVRQVYAGLMLSAVGLVALAILVPFMVSDTMCVDWRFPIMAALTAAAALRPGMRSAGADRIMAAALMVLALTRTGWITSIWQERQADVAAVEAVLAFVPAGAAILPVTRIETGGTPPRGRMLALGIPSYLHLPSLAVPLRQAFVPTLFAALGKQPLRVLPPWAEIAVSEGYAAPVHYLHAFAPPSQSAYTSYIHSYMAHWRERFGYVLVLNAQTPSADDETSLPELELLADRGFARMYRIVRTGEEGGGGHAGSH